MIIFIASSNIGESDLKRLREYLDETNSGVVIMVDDLDNVRTEREERE